MKNNKIILATTIMIFAVSIIFSANASCQVTENDTMTFYDGQNFTVIGRYHSEKNFARFPKRYENTLRKEVWGLGQNSAGISIRFRTNSPDIIVRWTVQSDNVMDHMAFTGIKGVDLYAYTDGYWKYVNTGRVKGKTNQSVLVKSGGKIEREYLLTQIKRFAGNISKTSSFVGMERSALHRKLKSLGLVGNSRGTGRGFVDFDD